jgi:hypothetical protein
MPRCAIAKAGAVGNSLQVTRKRNEWMSTFATCAIRPPARHRTGGGLRLLLSLLGSKAENDASTKRGSARLHCLALPPARCSCCRIQCQSSGRGEGAGARFCTPDTPGRKVGLVQLFAVLVTPTF